MTSFSLSENKTYYQHFENRETSIPSGSGTPSSLLVLPAGQARPGTQKGSLQYQPYPRHGQRSLLALFKRYYQDRRSADWVIGTALTFLAQDSASVSALNNKAELALLVAEDEDLSVHDKHSLALDLGHLPERISQ
jgi:hypothetical protein